MTYVDEFLEFVRQVVTPWEAWLLFFAMIAALVTAVLWGRYGEKTEGGQMKATIKVIKSLLTFLLTESTTSAP